MKQVHDRNEAYSLVVNDLAKTSADSVKILAGHFPLWYDRGSHTVTTSMDAWGIFTPYTMELGADIGAAARDMGKRVQYLLIADDHWAKPKSNTDWVSHGRDELYASMRLPGAKISDVLSAPLMQRGFGVDSIVRDDTGCPYISEIKLIADAKARGIIVDNDCAKAVNALLRDPALFTLEKEYLVGLIPGRCSGNICSYVLDRNISGLNSSCLFFKDDDASRRLSGIPLIDPFVLDDCNAGVWYRKDGA